MSANRVWLAVGLFVLGGVLAPLASAIAGPAEDLKAFDDKLQQMQATRDRTAPAMRDLAALGEKFLANRSTDPAARARVIYTVLRVYDVTAVYERMLELAVREMPAASGDLKGSLLFHKGVALFKLGRIDEAKAVAAELRPISGEDANLLGNWIAEFEAARDRRNRAATARARLAGEKKIRIGAILPMTGDLAPSGREAAHALRLAVPPGMEIGGFKIEVLAVDNAGLPDLSAELVEKLIVVEGCSAILGCISSANTRIVAKFAEQNGIPQLAIGATAADITAIGENIARVCFDDITQGAAAAGFAMKRFREANLPETERTAVIVANIDNRYSLDLAEVFKSRFESAGGTVIGQKTFRAGTRDFAALVKQVKDLKPKVIFLPIFYTPAGALLKQAVGHWDDIPIIGCDGLDSPALLDLAGPAFAHLPCFVVSHFFADAPGEKARAFVAAFRNANDGRTPGSMAALAYDAGLVLLDALRKCVATTGANFAPDAIRTHILSTNGFDGATGIIGISRGGDAIKQPRIARVTPDGFSSLP